MCLGIPVKITKISDNSAEAEVCLGDFRKKINIAMIENPEVGDYVILHAGFAISKLSEAEAEKTYQLINSLDEKNELMFV
ncbi:MAG: HypC/HybG/HupF family hydrogenase formation chaperone [Candidatus Wallbacteria bacterium]